MILICYDGSADSKTAIKQAGELLRGHPATVLTVWEPFMEVMTRTPAGFGMAPGMVNVDEIDTANEQSAHARAQEGAQLAAEAGLNAQPRCRSQVTSVADAILHEAEDLGAEAIVIGSRGLTGLKSVLLGSVSHHVIQHADRAVIVVPSAEVAAARAHRKH